MAKSLFVNMIKHIKLVSKHKWLVFKFSCKVGIPFRGIMHDLSKFSFTEFWESVKYYDGKISPIVVSRNTNGYSMAWLHHRSHNKHHEEYWLDIFANEKAAIIPYKYAVEMICDKLSASIAYNGKKWKQNMVYDYWMEEKKRIIVNPKTDKFVTEVLLQLKNEGIEKTIKKKNLKDLYNKYCIDDKTKYECKLTVEWKKVE